jgi:hypothetical protein
MRITKTTIFLICLCCSALVPAVWGQTAHAPAKAGILGYLDPQTGAFRPVPTATEENPDPSALTTYGGTITITLTITVKSTGLTSFSCTADVVAVDNAGSASARGYSENVNATATGSGTTRTCKMTIPYSWSLLTQSSDSMTTSYSVTGLSTSSPLIGRSSNLYPLDTRKIPASGTTTALTAAATL